MTKLVMEMKDITKSFGGVQALKGIDFQLEQGEIHGLLGENGAGKSTLIKVLGGVHQPDGGNIYINQNAVEITDVHTATQHGIGIIHQEIVLVPELTISENIFLGREPVNYFGIKNEKKMYDLATEMVKSMDLNFDVSTKVAELSIAQQQLVEIIKAISFEPKILIMDEPTSSLTGSDVENLFRVMKNLQVKGISIIYISHRFEELFEMTDRITVIRDGEYVGTVRTEETNEDELIRMMVGRSIESIYTRETPSIGDEVLRVEHLNSPGYFEDVSFNARKGEIIGFSGLVGAGRSELMLALFGALPVTSGSIYVNGQLVSINSPEEAIKYGIGLVPEDRKNQGLHLEDDIKFNITLANLENLTQNPLFISEDKKIESSQKYHKGLQIKADSIDTIVGTLSGGNQQKVVIGKWLSTNPSILILDEPTRGVDVGARSEIYTVINGLTHQGITIIMISSDLNEILNMADRTYIMREGQLAGHVSKGEMTQERIMYIATGGDVLDYEYE